jgi:hypothetical protein
MNLTKLSLGITAAVSAGFGIGCLIAPKQMLQKIDVKPTSGTGRTELRAMYGGLQLGLAAFFAYCAANEEMAEAGLLAQTLGLGGLALGRLAGIAVDRPKAIMYPLFAAEAGTAALGAAALKKLCDQRRNQETFVG